MSISMIAIVIAAAVISGLIVFLFSRTRITALEASLGQSESFREAMQLELQQERQLLRTCSEKAQDFEKLIVQLQIELKTARNRLIEELNNEEKQAEKFENIANSILRTQSASFNESQSKRMKDILDPLKEKIQHFEAKVEATNLQSIERHTSLKEQIHGLSRRTDQVSQDANNLAKALKGDFKAQGNWGEVILNNILEKSGLEKDREYFVQQSERNFEGRLLKPDVVIHLPDNKRLVIDSKVSLVSYDAMVAAENVEEQSQHQKVHAQAIRNHVQMLSDKNYHDLYNIQSPDFVMMFIPIDTAFSSALYADRKLYDDAFQKNIIIVTSSTLLATLKTVETLWRNDKQNRYALRIAEEAGKMYDKFVGFVDDMEKLGLQLNTVQKTYQSSLKKLSQGSGNVMRKAELVRSLGAKANKKLSPVILQGD